MSWKWIPSLAFVLSLAVFFAVVLYGDVMPAPEGWSTAGEAESAAFYRRVMVVTMVAGFLSGVTVAAQGLAELLNLVSPPKSNH